MQMTGKERQVLEMARQRRETSLAHIARRMGVSPEYARNIVQGLVEDGYLEEVHKEVYVTTPEVQRLLSPYSGPGLGRAPVSSYP